MDLLRASPRAAGPRWSCFFHPVSPGEEPASGAAAPAEQGPPHMQGTLLQLVSQHPPTAAPQSPATSSLAQFLHPRICITPARLLSVPPPLKHGTSAPCRYQSIKQVPGLSFVPQLLWPQARDSAVPTGSAGWAGNAFAGHASEGWRESHHWDTVGSLTQMGDSAHFQLAGLFYGFLPQLPTESCSKIQEWLESEN